MAPTDAQRDPERGRRIKELRRALGYTSAAALAARLDVHTRSVENWESGKPIDGPNLAKLAATLDTSQGYLWAGVDNVDGGDDLIRRIASLEGQVARLLEISLFVRRNFERISALEETGNRVEADVTELRELMEGVATAVKSLRTTGVAPPQPERAERPQPKTRATGGRTRTDSPRSPGR